MIPVVAVWEAADLEPQEATLLSQLLHRLLYFGRAESYCRFRIFNEQAIAPNCRLESAARALSKASATAGPRSART